MKYANRFVLVSALGLLSACSSSPRQAEGSFEYQDAEQSQGLKIPDGLAKPTVDDKLAVPESNIQVNRVAADVSVIPPRLLIPYAEGSRIDDKDPHTTIWFEQTEEIDDLETQIWQTITDYFAKREVALTKEDKESGYVETDWVDHTKLTGWGFWEAERTVERRKFALTLKMKPHGRSGTLSIELLEREAAGFTSDKSIHQEDNRGIATSQLNSLIGHFDYMLRLAAEKRRAQYAKGVTLSTKTLPNEDTVIVVDAKFGHAWLRFLDALNELGVVLTDINKLEGRIYGRINEKKDGLWESLFGDDSQSDLDLPAGDYVMELIRQGKNQTQILISNNNLEPITKEQVELILPELVDVMGKDIR